MLPHDSKEGIFKQFYQNQRQSHGKNGKHSRFAKELFDEL